MTGEEGCPGVLHAVGIWDASADHLRSANAILASALAAVPKPGQPGTLADLDGTRALIGQLFPPGTCRTCLLDGMVLVAAAGTCLLPVREWPVAREHLLQFLGTLAAADD